MHERGFAIRRPVTVTGARTRRAGSPGHAVWAVLCTTVTGCVAHLDRNAPGTVDVHAAPDSRPGRYVRAKVRDPGENVLRFLPGGFGGAEFGRPNPGGSVGVELSAMYGTLERSHTKPTLIPGLMAMPLHSFGASAGISLYESQYETIGPIYLEGQYAYYGLFTASAGYAVDAQQVDHGPQFSISAVGLLLRTRFLVDRGAAFFLGYVVKLPLTVVWSR